MVLKSRIRGQGKKDGWSSAFWISSHSRALGCEMAFRELWAAAAEVSTKMGHPVEVLLQHSLTEGLFGVLVRVTWPSLKVRHIGHKSEYPLVAVTTVARELRSLLGEANEKPEPKKKSEARKVNGTGHGRKNPAGERSDGLRKRRRKKGG